jgi:hypothetical protein
MMMLSDEHYLEQSLNNMMVQKQGYNQVITFAGLISFTRGALNGTRSLTTKNFTMCENRLITKVD